MLLHCSIEEATQVRCHAQLEYRNVSAYMLRLVMNAVRMDEKFAPGPGGFRDVMISGKWKRTGEKKPRTTMLLRCSPEEARLIREAAARRGLPMSEYVFRALRRSWKAMDEVPGYERS